MPPRSAKTKGFRRADESLTLAALVAASAILLLWLFSGEIRRAGWWARWPIAGQTAFPSVLRPPSAPRGWRIIFNRAGRFWCLAAIMAIWNRADGCGCCPCLFGLG